MSCILFARSSHRLATGREVISPSEECRGLVTQMDSSVLLVVAASVFRVEVSLAGKNVEYNKGKREL